MLSTLVRLSLALAALAEAPSPCPTGDGGSPSWIGTTVDATSGVRIAGARLLGPPDPATGSRPVLGSSDRWGEFEVAGGAGDDLLLAAPGYAPRPVRPPHGPADSRGKRLEPSTLVRGVRVRGRVVDPHGAPAGDVRVEVFVRTGDGFEHQPASAPTRTDANGAFELADPVPCAAEDGPETWLVACGASGTGWCALPPPLPGTGALEAPRARLLPVTSLAVRVLVDGAPVPDARVECRPQCAPWDASESGALPALFTARTDGEGRADFDGLPLAPRPAADAAGALDWVPALVYGVHVDGPAVAAWTCVLAPGPRREVAVRARAVDAPPPSATRERSASPRASAGAPHGEALPRARVVAAVVDARSGVPLDPTRAWVDPLGVSDPGAGPSAPEVHLQGGGVTVEGLAPGDWVLWVAARDHANASARVHVDDPRAQVLTTLSLGAPAVLSGTVVLDGAHDPGDVRVHCTLPRGAGLPWGADWQVGSRQVATVAPDEDGRFRIEGLTPGRHSVRVSGGGLRGDWVEVELVADDETELDLRAHTAATLHLVGGARAREAVAFYVLEEGADAARSHSIGPDTPRPPSASFEVAPGRIRYWVQRAEEAAGPRISEGELVVQAGEERDVVVPLPR